MTTSDFYGIIDAVLEFLSRDCLRRPQFYKKSGEEFEPRVVEAVQAALRIYENPPDISYVPGGHGFPDIVLKDGDGTKYGIEIKSSTGSGKAWKINGNSVMGTTKEDGIIETMIVFGKLRGEESEFRAKNYEQSVSNVGVTHSPRYLIDLDIPEGESFFERSGISYDQLNGAENPIKLITDYFLSIGQKAWWLAESTPAAIRMFGELSDYEQKCLMGYGFAHFPEVFSSGSRKFYRYMSWLVTEKSVVDAALRDHFTAGGKENIELCGVRYLSVPHIFKNLLEHREYIFQELYYGDVDRFSKDWGIEASHNYSDRVNQLVELICDFTPDSNLHRINKREFVMKLFSCEK